MISRLTIAAATLLVATAPVHASNWNLSLRNHMTITPPGGVSVTEMSGVTYLGPAAGGLYRFLSVQEGHGSLTQFDLGFDSTGNISSISNVSNVSTGVFLQDFEGIAFSNPARNSAFVSDEAPAGPNIRELNLATGTSLQPVSIPPIFNMAKRTNRGFESLTRTLDASAMWAANEQALTVDGPESTPTAGTTVRLLKFNVSGNTNTASQQFAYVVEAIHGSSALGSPQSGLSDLAAMPDGTLLALERSVAVTTPVYLSRIYEVNFAGATDVSVGALAAGLTGQSYTPVGKQNLFSGAIDGSSGQNMEGLTLGPRLANGNWVMIGVVDNSNADGSDPLSLNTVVSFVASPNTTGDFDANGAVDGADFLAWQRGLGKTIGAKLFEGDGDRDGDVDAADLVIWKAAAATAAGSPVPEPASFAILIAMIPALRRRPRPASRCKDAAR